MAICEICGKKAVAGKYRRHHRGVAGKRWKKRAPVTLRTFKPNIKKTTLYINGNLKKISICTKCLKRYKKDNPNQGVVKTALG